MVEGLNVVLNPSVSGCEGLQSSILQIANGAGIHFLLKKQERKL